MSTQNTSPADQNRYRTFEDLEVYQVAREFRKSMYRVNRRLPSLEKFELGSQIRRAAVSLANNIRWLRERKQGATLELREDSPAYGLTKDQLDALLADPAPPALTLQRINALTVS